MKLDYSRSLLFHFFAFATDTTAVSLTPRPADRDWLRVLSIKECIPELLDDRVHDIGNDEQNSHTDEKHDDRIAYR